MLEKFNLAETLFRGCFRLVRPAQILPLFRKHFVTVFYFSDHGCLLVQFWRIARWSQYIGYCIRLSAVFARSARVAATRKSLALGQAIHVIKDS
jgi:hypothetical protein